MTVHPPWLVNQKSVAGFQNRIQGLGQMYNICVVSVIKGFNATNLFLFSFPHHKPHFYFRFANLQ